MEFKPIMPEESNAAQAKAMENYSSGSSPSPSSSSSSASSDDSDDEVVAANSVTIGDVKLGGDSEGESDNGGFASGQEEFETAPDAPISAEMGREMEARGVFRPVAKVSNDDDDDDEEDVEGYGGGGAGDSEAKVFVEDLDGAKGVFVDKKLRELSDLLEAGGSVDKNLVSGKGPVTGTVEAPDMSLSSEVGAMSVAKTGVDKLKDEERRVGPEVAERVDEKLNELEGVNFTAGGDAVVETIQVDVLNSGAAVVGDVAGGKDSGIVERDIPVEGKVSLDNEFEPISSKAVEPIALNTAVSTNGESVDESVEVTSILQKDDGDVVGKGAEESSKNGTNVDLTDGASGAAMPVIAEGKQGTEGELEADSRAAPESNGTIVEAQEHAAEDGIPSGIESHQRELCVDSEDNQKLKPDEDAGAEEGSETDGEKEDVLFEDSEAAKQFLDELERGLGAGSQSGAESSQGNSQRIDGQVVTESDEEADTDEEGEGKELFDSAALAALLKAATGADDGGGGITITSQDGSRLFSVERPAGLGSSLRSVRPGPRSNRPSLFSSNVTPSGESENNLTEEEKKKLEKIQELRVKFLRLVQRLGYSPEDSLAAQVLYRLALVAGRQTSQIFSLESAKRSATELESEGKDDLGFCLNVLVLGKAGVGKSATINSILGENKAQIHAFETATTEVKEIVGTVHGVKIRFFDTPALRPSIMEQNTNRKILSNIKKFTKKCPPDIVLYVDRLDTQTRDLNDLPLLKTISGSLGSSIWRSAVVTLTHAASAPPDGPSGSPLNYDAFVTQRSHVVQQSIGQAVGDLRLMNPSLMNPVSLVENHPSCRKNREGEKILPNGQAWRPQLLLLSFSMKILSEASSLSKPQDPFDHKKLFGFRMRSPPLPYLLSWLLQSRTHPKLPSDQGIENGDSDVDLADLSESDEEDEEDEYDQLPPFKPLRKAQLAKLSKDQRRAYLEEYDYRVKLLQRKQWREELKRMREMKKKGKVTTDEYAYVGEDADADNGSPAAVPVPLHDMVLPPSFDSDNPAYRYRFLEPTSQFIARPVLDTHGWDHDCGYDGVNLEHSLAIASKFPTAVAVQITKDKKEFNIHLDSSVAAKYGESGSTMAGFDIQNIGKQLAYILRGETKFKSFRKNRTAAGFSVTFLGENVATGLKVEDQIALGKRLVFVGSAGTVRSQGDSVYGANLEMRLREADFPIGQDQSSLGLSLVRWRGDLALGANFQSQFSIGRSSKIGIRAGLNNKMSGQISVRTSSSEQLQLALAGIIPIATAIYRNLWPGVSDNYPIY
ncbi:hypothetical protein CRG98_042425 [Punica granatum]|uniref:AIG1-type G domain-containing protein n=1 Tax=Punica granatum TaxID=22663 RepID=A0A2I0HZN7_PUNGR|nr:hypothetical protein CRG98_042425 [Punica granatum]